VLDLFYVNLLFRFMQASVAGPRQVPRVGRPHVGATPLLVCE